MPKISDSSTQDTNNYSFVIEDISEQDRIQCDWAQIIEFNKRINQRVRLESWLIDRQNNMCFWHIKGGSAPWERESIFGMYWDRSIIKIQALKTYRKSPDPDLKLNHAHWEVIRVEIPLNKEFQRNHIERAIEEALVVNSSFHPSISVSVSIHKNDDIKNYDWDSQRDVFFWKKWLSKSSLEHQSAEVFGLRWRGAFISFEVVLTEISKLSMIKQNSEVEKSIEAVFKVYKKTYLGKGKTDEELRNKITKRIILRAVKKDLHFKILRLLMPNELESRLPEILDDLKYTIIARRGLIEDVLFELPNEKQPE